MILNLTQHKALPTQVEVGVVNLPDEDAARLRELLTFDELPSTDEVEARADALVDLAKKHGANRAMIGGALFLMPVLEQRLREAGIEPLYAFSKRVTIEKVDEKTGKAVKTSEFVHEGFYSPRHLNPVVEPQSGV